MAFAKLGVVKPVAHPMKKNLLFLVLLALQAAPVIHAETLDLQTMQGKVYHQCRIVKIEADGLLFRHANGAGKVLFKDLTKPLRDHFGYDPEKARAHEEKVKAEAQKQREVARQKTLDAWRAQDAANERAIENQTLLALRAALTQAPAQSGGDWVALSGSTSLIQGSQLVNGADYYRASKRETWVPWCGVRNGRLPLAGVSYSSTGCNVRARYAGACAGGLNYGFTPVPFFAVPGVGPNVPVINPVPACRPHVTRSVIVPLSGR